MATTHKHESLSVFTDGGSRGNPGPAAIGVAFFDAAGTQVEGHGEYLGETTNNQAEYRALLFALKRAVELGVRTLTCYLDSELVVRQMNGVYRVKDPDLRPLFEDAKQTAAHLEKVTYSHVRREKNKVADRLVNEALDHETGRT
jgi:ribonuclease HI